MIPLEGVKKNDFVVSSTITSAPVSVPVRLYSLSNSDKHSINNVMIFIHGGGWSIGDLDLYDDFCAITCEHLKMPILSISYRLAPVNKFPAAVNDVVSVCKWCCSKYDRIILCGDSSGGNLCLSACIELRHEKLFQDKLVAQILFYPFIDNNFTLPSFKMFDDEKFLSVKQMIKYVENYTGLFYLDAAIKDNYLIYPALYKKLHIFPPTLIISAEFDILISSHLLWAERMREAKRSVSLEIIRGSHHGFITFPFDNKRFIAKSLQVIDIWLKQF